MAQKELKKRIKKIDQVRKFLVEILNLGIEDKLDYKKWHLLLKTSEALLRSIKSGELESRVKKIEKTLNK